MCLIALSRKNGDVFMLLSTHFQCQRPGEFKLVPVLKFRS